MRLRARRAALLAVMSSALIGIVAALALAAPPAISLVAPSPAEGATLTTNTVTFAFTYPKKPQATKTLTCALSGPTSLTGLCDPSVVFGSEGSQSGKSYTGLADGSYTFTVSLILTDGGRSSAVRHFTVTAAGGGHVYWTSPSLPGTIGRANQDGSSANASFISGASYPYRVAIDANYIYWTNFSAGTIGRANLDGTNPNQSFVSTGDLYPTGVAVDARPLYVSALHQTK